MESIIQNLIEDFSKKLKEELPNNIYKLKIDIIPTEDFTFNIQEPFGVLKTGNGFGYIYAQKLTVTDKNKGLL